MRKYIELIIGGTKVDLPSDSITVELNYKVQDGLKVAGASSERSLSLPYSKTNKAAFGELGDIKTAYLNADGVPVLYGKAQFNELSLKDSAYYLAGKTAKVALYGSNADWIIQLGDKKLSELDWVDEEHILNDANVTNGFTALYPFSSFGYHFWRLKDWAYNTAASAIDSSPIIFIRTLLDKIFNELGYTYNSDFFSTVVGKSLGLPVLFPREYPKEFADEYLNGFWEKTTTAGYTVVNVPDFYPLDFDTHTAPPKAPDPFADSVAITIGNAGEYTVKIAGYYKFTYSITAANFVGFTTVQMSFALLDSTGGLLAGSQGVTMADGDTISGSFVYYAEINEVLYTGFIGTTPDIGIGDTFDITAARVEVYSDTAEITYGAPIDFKYLLHDWTCRDLLKGLTHAFNLAFETDVFNQVVTIEPKNDYLYRDPATFAAPAGALEIKTGFYTGTQEILFDISKDALDKFDDIGNETALLYKSDSNDTTVNAIEENGDFKLYEARYSRSLDRFKIEKDEIENPFFAPTLHLFDASIQHPDSLTVPLLPLLTENNYIDDPTSTDRVETYEPRLLYFAGNRNLGIFINYYNEALSIVAKVAYPEAFSVNYADVSNTDFSLAFNNLSVNGGEALGLLQRFYLQDMARTRISVKRQTWAYFRALDILNLTFRPVVQMDGKQYLLSEVLSYNPLSIDSTKIVMVLDDPQRDEDLTAIEGSPIEGFISNVV